MFQQIFVVFFAGVEIQSLSFSSGDLLLSSPFLGLQLLLIVISFFILLHGHCLGLLGFIFISFYAFIVLPGAALGFLFGNNL